MCDNIRGFSMIKSLRLKNFKSYRDSGPIPFAPLTLLIRKRTTQPGRTTSALMPAVVLASNRLQKCPNLGLLHCF
jgi:hypothetical protein